MRASREYRLQVARNLLDRFYLEHAAETCCAHASPMSETLTEPHQLAVAGSHSARSAHLHVSGEAVYADGDIGLPAIIARRAGRQHEARAHPL
jgi:hypothetical protein